MTCDEILRLIRAMKTYNLKTVQVGDLTLLREGEVPGTPKLVREDAAIELDPLEQAEKAQAQQELDEYEAENLLISDPEEYERRVANVQ